VVSSGYPPASWRYAQYHWAKETVLNLPWPLVTLARRLAGSPRETPYVVPEPFAASLRDEVTRNTASAKLLDGEQVLRTLQQTGGVHPFFCLLTWRRGHHASREKLVDHEY
jgi:hypothetical protein